MRYQFISFSGDMENQSGIIVLSQRDPSFIAIPNLLKHDCSIIKYSIAF